MKYKTLLKGLKSQAGECQWTIGEWKVLKGPLEPCAWGYHCSERIIDAIAYVRPEVLAEVETAGAHLADGDNKECWKRMRITRLIPWTQADNTALAIYCAELVLPIWAAKYPADNRPTQAITAAKAWMDNPTPKNAYAASSAADAASSATSATYADAYADSAAYAYAAASAAAYAARAAARAAAYAAASAASADSAARAAAYAASYAASGTSATSASAYAAYDAAYAAGSAYAAKRNVKTQIEAWIQARIAARS